MGRKERLRRSPRTGFSIKAQEQGREFLRRTGFSSESRPLCMPGVLLDDGGDGGEHGSIAQARAVKVAQALEIDERAIEAKPVEHLVEEPRIVARPEGAGQDERLRINHAVGTGGATMTGYAKARPRTPEPVQQRRDEVKVGRRHGEIQFWLRRPSRSARIPRRSLA